MVEFPGITHTALTVSDLDRSVQWYESLFGGPPDKLDEGGAFRAAVWLLRGGTVIALHQFENPVVEAFDEFRPGLDHLAFQCSDRSDLATWMGRLDALGIAHSDITDEPYGSGLSFRDPDNIALEFFSPPPQPTCQSVDEQETRPMPSPAAPHARPTPPARLHHHAFVTTDQEATRKFYEDVVGLPLVATWTEVEHLMGGEEQEFCHTMYELGDGGCLAFFQFADPGFSEQFAPPPPFSLFRHFAMLVTPEQQESIRSRAENAGFEVTMFSDHGYCESLYLTDPNGLLLEFTVDHPDIETIDATRRNSAHGDLTRWLGGDHSSNNEWRPTS